MAGELDKLQHGAVDKVVLLQVLHHAATCVPQLADNVQEHGWLLGLRENKKKKKSKTKKTKAGLRLWGSSTLELDS